MKKVLKITCIFLIILLANCTLGPNYHPPINLMPSHYSGQPQVTKNRRPAACPRDPGGTEHCAKSLDPVDKPRDVVTTQENTFWWSSFNDPLLINLINQALKGANLDIQKAYASIRQARAELNMANAEYYPQLQSSGRFVRDHLSANSEIISAFPRGFIPLTYTDARFGFDASWEIDLFGHTRRTVEASKARFQSIIENQYYIALTTSAEVAKMYTQYRILQQRILIAQHTVASYNRTMRLVGLQHDAGFATTVDLHRIKSQLLSAQSTLPYLQAQAKATLASLAVLVGEFPEDLFKECARTAPIPYLNTNSLNLGLPSELLQRRPDIRMAERNLAAATANIGVAVTNQFPRIQLIGNLGFDTVKPGTYFDAASRYWTIGPQILAMPLFQGFRLKNAVKEQKALADIAFDNYKYAILQALADVESSLVRYKQEQLTRNNLLASYDKLKSIRRLTQLQYREGQITLMDLLDVERQLDQINDQYIQSQGQITLDLISLYKSLGGSWVVV